MGRFIKVRASFTYVWTSLKTYGMEINNNIMCRSADRIRVNRSLSIAQVGSCFEVFAFGDGRRFCSVGWR